MAIEKQRDGRWHADIRPNGAQGRRFRRTFKTKLEAERWAVWLTAKLVQSPDWDPKPKRDARRLSDLVSSWYKLHGCNLKDAENRIALLENFVRDIGDPLVTAFGARDFAEYRQARLAAGIKPATLNNLHAYLRALFNELNRLGEWSGPNPLGKLRQLKKPDTELSFLSAEQIRAVLEACKAGRNPDTYLVAVVCLATGARWSEAEGLVPARISVSPSLVTFGATKSGRVRSVPIVVSLAEALSAREPDESGRIFRSCYSAFGQALERAGISLPDGQRSHVLRHTFASHFMQGGGSILALQRLLGHQSLTMTMRYAHLAPGHIAEAAKLNPLAGWTLFGQ